MAVFDPRGGGEVHVDKVLSGVSLGYTNEEYVGEALFPVVNVVKQSDKYYQFGREGWRPEIEDGVDNSLRAPGTVATEVPGMTVSTDTYFAQERSLQIAITDEEVVNADTPLAPRSDGTKLVTDQLMVAKELQIKTLVTTVGNYASTNRVTLSGTDQWSDYANSAPKTDVKTGRDAVHARIFKPLNWMVIPYEVMSQLEDHTNIIERIKYSERGILTQDIIAAFFGVDNIMVPGSGFNSANPGQAEAIGYIWGKDVVMGWNPPSPGMKVPAFGYEFNWSYGGQRRQVTRWREEARKSDIVRVGHRYDLKLIAVDGSGDSIAGYLIKDAVA